MREHKWSTYKDHAYSPLLFQGILQFRALDLDLSLSFVLQYLFVRLLGHRLFKLRQIRASFVADAFFLVRDEWQISRNITVRTGASWRREANIVIHGSRFFQYELYFCGFSVKNAGFTYFSLEETLRKISQFFDHVALQNLPSVLFEIERSLIS